MSLIRILNYIDGQLVPPIENDWLDNREPATGEVYALLPQSGSATVDAAVQSANRAFAGWRKTPLEKRAKYLFKLADLIEQHADQLVQAESRDNGKTIKQAALVDIPRAATNFRFFAAAAQGFASESYHNDGSWNVTLRQPLGPVVCISPWNLPLYLLTWKIAPALMMGNCVIAKPSEVTPLTAWMLSELACAAELPAGVLNLIHGNGSVTGNALISHPQVKAISFTGGTTTGQHIASTVAPLFKKTSFELGGKNPNLIFADCDYSRMLETTIRSSFSNQGQICLCGSRILVEDAIYDRFLSDFVARTQNLKVGDPQDPQSDLGAVVSAAHFDKIMNAISKARQLGGNILCGGHPVNVPGRCAQGCFIAPTVIVDLPQSCLTNQEEIFGPVVTVQRFHSTEQALQIANDVPYGLSASVWTKDMDRALSVAEQIDAGVVWVNGWLVRDLRTPFGGVKHSGLGREGGVESFHFWTQTKNVCLNYSSV